MDAMNRDDAVIINFIFYIHQKPGNREVRFELEFTRVSNSLTHSNSPFFRIYSELDTRTHSFYANFRKTRPFTQLAEFDSSLLEFESISSNLV